MFGFLHKKMEKPKEISSFVPVYVKVHFRKSFSTKFNYNFCYEAWTLKTMTEANNQCTLQFSQL